MLDQISASEAVKWAVLVFAAGFIGFFGKSLARAMVSILQKMRRSGPGASEASGNPAVLHDGLPPGAGTEQGLPESIPKGTDPKALKKALKAREKALKKQGKP